MLTWRAGFEWKDTEIQRLSGPEDQPSNQASARSQIPTPQACNHAPEPPKGRQANEVGGRGKSQRRYLGNSWTLSTEKNVDIPGKKGVRPILARCVLRWNNF